MQNVMYIVRRLKEEMEDQQIPVVAWVSTPFGTACMLRGIENLMRDLRKETKFIHKLMGRCLDYCAQYAENHVEAGADIIFTSNPTACRGLISRVDYEQVVSPYSRRLFDRIWEMGKPILYHVCGDWTDRFDVVLAEGIQVLHVDKVDLAEIKPTIGKQVCLMGNVKSVETMLMETPEKVEQDALNCIRKGAAGGGYVLAADCLLASETPPTNIHALLETGLHHGRYTL